MTTAKAGRRKVAWSGRVVAVQPRIRLTRPLDERHHGYQEYMLGVDGTCGDKNGELQIALERAVHQKHQFHACMEVSGLPVPVPYPRLQTVSLTPRPLPTRCTFPAYRY